MNIPTKSLVNICVLILVGFTMGMVASSWRFAHRSRPGFGSSPFHEERGNKQEHEERMLKMFTKRLKLDDEQQGKVKAIISEGGGRLKALHTETLPKFDEIRDDIQAQLRAVLVGDQIEKFDQLDREMEKRPGSQGSPTFH